MLFNKLNPNSAIADKHGEAVLFSIYASDAYPKHGYHLVTPSP